jgi:hypothetical protein
MFPLLNTKMTSNIIFSVPVLSRFLPKREDCLILTH